MIKLLRPSGAKAIAAENIVLRQQLITLSRQQKRSPKLKTSDRIIFGLLTNLGSGYPKGTGEIKSVPYTPTSNPFVERLIGILRREYLDHVFFACAFG